MSDVGIPRFAFPASAAGTRERSGDFIATGKLRVSLEDLSYGLKTLRKSWLDAKDQRLEDCLGTFSQNLPRPVQAIKLDREDRERTRQKWAEEQKCAEEAPRHQAEFQRQAKHVSRLIEEWDRSKQLPEFAYNLGTSSDSQGLNEEGQMSFAVWPTELNAKAPP